MSTLFVSDLHLDAAYPAAIAQFDSFLQGPARAAEALYILGDLFETWVGDDDDDAQRARVCEALRALSDAGVACHVCHGNRDFLLGSGFEQRTGCRLLADPTIIDLGGRWPMRPAPGAVPTPGWRPRASWTPARRRSCAS